MTLAQLRHFVALAASGSFSKSALLLHLTQPALSRSIRALEDELGMPLFDRVGRRSELTAFGSEVAARARQIVSECDELRDSGRRMRSGDAGAIGIGMGSGPGAILMTPLLVHMATKHPAVRIEVARGSTELLTQSLRARTLDALVVDARALQPAVDLCTETLPEMRAGFLCRRGHPLARKRGGVAFEALQRYPVASTPLSDEVARVLVERYGPQAHPSVFVTVRCQEIASLVEVARESDAVLLTIYAAAGGLVELAVDPPMNGSARFCIVTLRGRAEAPALTIVRRLVHEVMHD